MLNHTQSEDLTAVNHRDSWREMNLLIQGVDIFRITRKRHGQSIIVKMIQNQPETNCFSLMEQANSSVLIKLS